MPLTFPDVFSLRDAIRSRFRERRALVGIEGHSTSGKTWLTRRLVAETSAACISTDSYVIKERDADSYVGYLDVDQLRTDIALAQATHSLSFLEGICLRHTLTRLKLDADAFVYCKRITPAGLWADDPDNYIHLGKIQEGLSFVDAQSVAYHLAANPAERADWVFTWREG